MPYQPFAEALDQLLAAVDAPTVVRRFGGAAPELARLVPRRAADLGLPEPVGHGDPDAERGRLFGAVIATLAELARTQPVLLVLDDLHWARRPTIDLLDQLMRDQALSNILVVAVAPVGAGRHRRGAAGGAARSAPAARRDPPPAVGLRRRRDRGLRGRGRRPRRGDGPAGRRRRAGPPDRRERVPARRAVAAPDRDRAAAPARGPVDDHRPADRRRQPRGRPRGRRRPARPPRRRRPGAARDGRRRRDDVRPGGAGGGDGRARRHRPGDARRRRAVAHRRRVRGRWLPLRPRADPPFGLRRSGAAPSVGVTTSPSPERSRSDRGPARRPRSPSTWRRPCRSSIPGWPWPPPSTPPTPPPRRWPTTTPPASSRRALAIAPDGRVDLLLRLADATMRAGDVARAKQRCLEAHDLAQRTVDPAGRIAAALAFGEAAWRDAREGAIGGAPAARRPATGRRRDHAGPPAGVVDPRPGVLRRGRCGGGARGGRAGVGPGARRSVRAARGLRGPVVRAGDAARTSSAN